VAETGDCCAFEGDGRVLLGAGAGGALDDADQDFAVGLVGGGDGAVELGVVVGAGIEVAKKVCGGNGGGDRVDFDDESAEGCVKRYFWQGFGGGGIRRTRIN
jgi:hypothetical protein